MLFEIIPAIDLRNGKAVRPTRGEFGAEARVADDPLKTAKRFADEGAMRLHVIDLDGVRVGTPQNLVVIKDIIRKCGMKVQVGGGLRTIELVERVLNAGADRVIVGTAAASQTGTFVYELLHKYGEQVIIGADTKDGFISTEGWTAPTIESTEMFGTRLAQAGAKRFLFTDVALEGVNVEETVAFAQHTGVPVLASGGMVDIEDIKKLAEVQPEGVEGVIIGKALYTGSLTLADALSIANESTEI